MDRYISTCKDYLIDPDSRKTAGLFIAYFIPAKWSDFSFYGEVLDTWTDGMTGFLELPFYALEIHWFINCLSLGFWVALGGAASCYAAHYTRKLTGERIIKERGTAKVPNSCNEKRYMEV